MGTNQKMKIWEEIVMTDILVPAAQGGLCVPLVAVFGFWHSVSNILEGEQPKQAHAYT